jgi:hypothetical protein
MESHLLLKPRCPFPHTFEYMIPFKALTVVINDSFVGMLEPAVLDPYNAIIRGTHQPSLCLKRARALAPRWCVDWLL